MAKKKFKLISSIPAEDEKDGVIKEYHESWRKVNSLSNANFVPIFGAFKEKHLATLEPGALRLYLFFAFSAHNQYGNSWYSIEKIAEFFNTQTRTVNNWIKVLVERNLIYREQKGKRSHTTYLVPYSNTIIRHQLKRDIKEDNQKVLDMFLKKVTDYDFLYGDVIGVYHLFQWNSDKKKKPIKINGQSLFIITKRDDEVIIGHQLTLKKSGHLGVNELYIEDSDIGRFDSPFIYEGENIKGLFLTHEIKMSKSNTRALLELIEDLSRAENWDWEEHPKYDFGLISEFFPEEETEESEE